jgi:hypothetical protein
VVKEYMRKGGKAERSECGEGVNNWGEADTSKRGKGVNE